MLFYKHDVYKHTEPDFYWKIKHMLSILPASKFAYQLKP